MCLLHVSVVSCRSGRHRCIVVLAGAVEVTGLHISLSSRLVRSSSCGHSRVPREKDTYKTSWGLSRFGAGTSLLSNSINQNKPRSKGGKRNSTSWCEKLQSHIARGIYTEGERLWFFILFYFCLSIPLCIILVVLHCIFWIRYIRFFHGPGMFQPCIVKCSLCPLLFSSLGLQWNPLGPLTVTSMSFTLSSLLVFAMLYVSYPVFSTYLCHALFWIGFSVLPPSLSVFQTCLIYC